VFPSGALTITKNFTYPEGDAIVSRVYVRIKAEWLEDVYVYEGIVPYAFSETESTQFTDIISFVFSVIVSILFNVSTIELLLPVPHIWVLANKP